MISKTSIVASRAIFVSCHVDATWTCVVFGPEVLAVVSREMRLHYCTTFQLKKLVGTKSLLKVLCCHGDQRSTRMTIEIPDLAVWILLGTFAFTSLVNALSSFLTWRYQKECKRLEDGHAKNRARVQALLDDYNDQVVKLKKETEHP